MQMIFPTAYPAYPAYEAYPAYPRGDRPRLQMFSFNIAGVHIL